MAHSNIGVAMARSGEKERAILAFETALRFEPNMVNAHRYLAALHRDNGGDSEKAAFHQQEAAKIIRSRPRARNS
jgi:tetratricopeptide (TPR) repeat protein